LVSAFPSRVKIASAQRFAYPEPQAPNPARLTFRDRR